MVPFASSLKNLTVCVQKYYGFVNISRANTRDFQNDAGKHTAALL